VDTSLNRTDRFLITVCVTLASFLQALDTTIANIALPHIGGTIAATPEQISWVLTSYIVAAAITIPLTGWLADRYGRKQVLLFSVVGFTLTSALCGMAQSLFQIVLFRMLQGVCGAALMPQSQAVLLDINPPERHGRAMATSGIAVLVGPIIGPLLGAWLTDNYSWRWVFYINVPVGIVCALGISSFMPRTQTHRSTFDFLGFAALSIALGALQLLLDRGQLHDWFDSGEIRLEAAAGVLALYVFLVHSLTTASPFVSLKLFTDRNFATGSLTVFVIGVVLFATLVLLPPFLQNIMRYPVSTAGVVMAPRGVGTLLSMLIVGRLMTALDPRLIIVAGLALTAASLWVMSSFSPLMDERLIIWSGFTQGVGAGMAWVPLSAVAFATLATRLRSMGTSIFNLLRNIGSSIGISIVTALLARNAQIMHSRLVEHIMPYGMQGPPSAPYSFTDPHGIAALDAAVARQAEMIAYNNDFKLMLILTLAALPLPLLLKPRAAPRREPVVAFE